MLPILGEPISAQTVSRVAKQLDAAVQAYHQRPLSDRYEGLILDAVACLVADLPELLTFLRIRLPQRS